MTIEELERILRCEVTGEGFDRALRTYGPGLRVLRALGRSGDVVLRLGELPPFSPPRDELLGDLLRLYRRSGAASALGAVCYALLPSVERLVRRLASKAPWRCGELLNDLVYVTVVRAAHFDPDRRSLHVQAGLERDIQHELWRGWLREHAVRKRLQALAHALPRLRADLLAGWCSVDDLLDDAPAARPRARAFDEDDREEMEHVLRSLLDAGAVDEREFWLLRESRVFGRRVAAVADELGMTEAAAHKAIQRAGHRVRAALRARLLEPSGHLQEPPGAAPASARDRRIRATAREETSVHA